MHTFSVFEMDEDEKRKIKKMHGLLSKQVFKGNIISDIMDDPVAVHEQYNPVFVTKFSLKELVMIHSALIFAAQSLEEHNPVDVLCPEKILAYREFSKVILNLVMSAEEKKEDKPKLNKEN